MIRFRKFRHMEWVDLITALVKTLQPDVYVELGVQKGYTFNAISPLVKKAYAIDVHPMIQSTIVQRPNVVKIQKTTDAAAKEWNSPIDLLFIDANHEAGQVLKDVENFSPYVVEGTGLILLHDTHPVNADLLAPGYCWTAYKAAEEIRRSVRFENLEIVTLPGPWAGLSIIRKSARQLSWREEPPVEIKIESKSKKSKILVRGGEYVNPYLKEGAETGGGE